MAGRRQIGRALDKLPEQPDEPATRFNAHTGEYEPAPVPTSTASELRAVAGLISALAGFADASERANSELIAQAIAMRDAYNAGLAAKPWYKRWLYRASDNVTLWLDGYLEWFERKLRGRP